MRESSLTARLDEHGNEVLVVQVPRLFSLLTTAQAMHAVVDPQLKTLTARQTVGRSRVRQVLRQIVLYGWPEPFEPDPERVEHWKQWLIDQKVFTEL